jgi:hypothetical protein
MSKYTDQYVLYGYWDYGYAEGDVLATDGAGSVTGIATVVPNGSAIYSFSGSITGTATFTGLGLRQRLADGSITSTGSAEGQPIRVRYFGANIDALATVTGLGGIVVSGSGILNSICTVNVRGNAIFASRASMRNDTSSSATGYIYGEEWQNIASQATAWDTKSEGSNIWTDKTTGNNKWQLKG